MEQTVRLKNARTAFGAEHSEKVDLYIDQGRLLPFGMRLTEQKSVEMDLSGHLILPGLINAHDHLEFNLFSRIGKGPWPNAGEWAAAVHRPDCPPVKEHRAVPRRLRLAWGGVKNLLSGVTTVAHHNPWEAVFSRDFPVRVVRRFGWAHSLHFSPDLVERYRDTPQSWPFIIHAAEGTDACAQGEIPKLDQLGVLNQRTVLVHAVGATAEQLSCIEERGSSIVWCPTSNLFTLGATLARHVVREFRELSLGTDSTLTAEGDMIDEIRAARDYSGMPFRDLFPLVTTNPARALRLDSGEGAIREGGFADLLVVRDHGQTAADALRDLHPELVLVGGRLMLVSCRLASGFDSAMLRGLQAIEVEGRGKWLIRAGVAQMYSATAGILSEPVRLAGKLISP